MRVDRARRNLLLAAGALAFNTAATPPVIARDSFRTSDGVRLSFLGADRQASRPIVFVPGWCLPADLWLPQLGFFAATHAVYALDPRGQGESDTPEAGYTVDRRAADIDEFLQRLAQPAVLVAWSLAGLEALQLAHRFGTRRLAALALVDSSVGEGPAGRGDGVAAFRQRLLDDRTAALREFAAAIFRRPPAAAEIGRLAESMQRMPLSASLDLLAYPQPREHWRATARTFGKPLLYAYTPQYAQQARRLKLARPSTMMSPFPDAGHALFADAPEEFREALARFVRALPPQI
jgi:microsomal epoxide hydrolase